MTSRDKLQRVVDLGRKTSRYWWLILLFTFVGGALSLGFAFVRSYEELPDQRVVVFTRDDAP